MIEVTDSFVEGSAPPSDFDVMEFHEGALSSRDSLSPIQVSQSEGINFSISGGQIRWQGWQFHLRFDPRQGTILNNIRIESEAGLRPVAYEVAMSDVRPIRTPISIGSIELISI